MIRIGLLVALASLALGFAAAWAASVIASRRRVETESRGAPSLAHIAIGAVTNFFDTLGIGSFAPTTSAFKMLRLVRDECIPGTLNIGHALPTVAQALIFIAVVRVDSTLLLSFIAISMLGGWQGAGIVAKLPRRRIQLGMGGALLIAATFMALSQLGLFPTGGTALGLPFGRLTFALAAAFVIGALLMLGIGNYAPSLVLLSLLGMDPRAAFPVMMAAGAMVEMIGGLRFMRTGRYDLRAALGLTLGGIPAVLVAGLIVRSMPLGALRWMVVCVVIYAAVVMLRSTRSTAPAERLVTVPDLDVA